MKNILHTLVKFRTISGDFVANAEALNFIDHFLSKRGMHVKQFEFNGYRSLVATTRKTQTSSVMLAAHIDVVPASTDMFELREEDGKLYGRGTLDMKFAIAAYMQIVDDLQENLADYDFSIMITTDEELGGLNGVPHVLEQGYLPKVCILPDGGDDWQLQLKSKGFLYLRLKQVGKPSHGSRPWLGENAILALLNTIRDIQTLFPDAGPETNTLNVGQISGGNAPNQVADFAEAYIDIRLKTEAEKVELLRSIEQICEKHKTTMHIEINGAATEFALDNEYINPFVQLVTKYTGIEVVGTKTLGSNDTRYFTPYDIPCISFYPIGGGHHGLHEWIAADSLNITKQVITEYLKQIAYKPQPAKTAGEVLTSPQ